MRLASRLQPWDAHADLDVIALAVAQRSYPARVLANVKRMLRTDEAVIDVKATLLPTALPPGLEYWSL